MANLTKTFETEKDSYGFTNDLTINVNYNEEENSIDGLEVYAYNSRKCVITDLTELFETVPEFVTLVDNIAWREIYANDKAEKEVYDEQ